MNKYEFRSTYNKIALSDEFKASAKEKLLSQFEKVTSVSDETYIDEHNISKEIHIDNRGSNFWKYALGIGAAAVVGLGIWGVSRLGGTLPVDPTSNQGGISETSETNEQQNIDDKVIVDDERFGLVEQSITFPAYYDMVKRYDKSISSAIPFDLKISLPEGWYFETPEIKGGLSTMQLKDENGEVLGVVDYDVYEIYPDVTPENESYYQMVYNQLMLNSMVSWDSEYTIVKREGGLCSATCRIITDAPEMFEDWSDGYGILAHNDDLRVYVHMSINKEIDDELHAAIARSVDISESVDGISQRIADDYLLKRDALITQGLSLDEVSFKGVETDKGRLIFAADTNVKTTGLITYYLCDGRMYSFDYITADSIQVFESENDLLLVFSPKNIEFVSKEPDDNIVCVEEKFYTLNNDGEIEYLCSLIRNVRNVEVVFCNIKDDIDSDGAEITYEQYLTEKIKLLQGYSPNTQYTFGDFVAHNGDRDVVAKCVKDAFNTDKPNEEYTDALEMMQHTITSKVYHLREDGKYTVDSNNSLIIDIDFALPVDWDLDHSVAYLNGEKIFEIGVPYPEDEGIDYDNFKNDRLSGIEYTVHEEKIGTQSDPFKYYIYKSAPEKYSNDGSYDAYWYVVNVGGYNIAMHFIADLGVDKSVFEQVLSTMYIKNDKDAYTGSPIFGVNTQNKRIAEDVSKHFFENYMSEHTWDTGSLKATAAKTNEGMIIVAEDLDSLGKMALYMVSGGTLSCIGTYEPYKTEFTVFYGENGTLIRIVNSEDTETSHIVHKSEKFFKVHYLDGAELIQQVEYDYDEIEKAIKGTIVDSYPSGEEISYEQYLQLIDDVTNEYTELKCGVAEMTIHEQDNDEEAFSNTVRYAINETDGVYREPMFVLSCYEYTTGLSEYAESWLYEGEDNKPPSWTDRDSTLQMLYDYGIESYMSLPVYEGHTLYAELDEGGVITSVKRFDSNMANVEPVTTFTENSITFPYAEINSRLLYEITVTYPQGTVVGFLGVHHYPEDIYRKMLLSF